MMDVFTRRIRSFFKKSFVFYINRINRIKIKLLEENISLGKNIKIAKNVNIKTTDGGKIIIKNNVSIEENCCIYAQYGTIIIDCNSFIGFGSQIVAKKSIKIGKNALISAYSIIRDANHGIKKSVCINSQSHTIKEITIKDDVWIGAHTVVTAGSEIDQGVVVGANAVVTKYIEPYTVVGGIPAKFIKKRV